MLLLYETLTVVFGATWITTAEGIVTTPAFIPLHHHHNHHHYHHHQFHALGLLESFRLQNCSCHPVLRDSMQFLYWKKWDENELLKRGSCLDFRRIMAEFLFLTLDHLCELIERCKSKLRSSWIWSCVGW